MYLQSDPTRRLIIFDKQNERSMRDARPTTHDPQATTHNANPPPMPT